MMNESRELSPPQKRTLKLMVEMEEEFAGGINGHKPGLGKTVMSFALIAEKWNGRPCLFLVPPSLVDQVAEELSKFTHFSVCAHDLSRAGKADVTVLSIHTLKAKDFPFWIKWERVFVDESHERRNERSMLLKAMLKLDSKYRWAMSGTSLMNRITDLFAISKFLQLGFESQEDFVEAIEYRGLLNAILIQSTPEDIATLNLQEKEDTELSCKLNDSEMTEYAKYFDLLNSGQYGYLEASHEFRRITAACEDKQSKVQKYVASVLRGKPGEKVIIFMSYRATIAQYESWFKSKGVPVLVYTGEHSRTQRSRVIELFNKHPSYRILLLGFKCGNCGINLQVANHVILNEPVWNEAINEQAIARCHRKGQTRQVQIIRCVVEGTIEEEMQELAAHKNDQIQRAYGAI